MSKEIADIVKAYKEAQLQGRQTALATIVHVEGSSYRRPGARMLVEDNGKITGAISGGCLEGDALQKALLAINQNQNKLVTYNTLHEDDIEFGVQLGCNGIVHILFEPIQSGNADNPVALLENFLLQRKNAVLVTMFSLSNFYGHQPGTCYFFNDLQTTDRITNSDLSAQVKEDAEKVFASKRSMLKQYTEHDLTAFVELLQPPLSLIIIGAGNDVLPVVDMAAVLGWQITVADGRSTHANKLRFSKADKVIVARPADVITQLVIDERTVFVLMTHNYNYDVAFIALLLQYPCRYVGILGPRKRWQRMLTDLLEQGLSLNDEQTSSIYAPVGLDIGAEAPEEIALSVVSEIKSVMNERKGTSLRDRMDGIHSRAGSLTDEFSSGA